MITEGVTSLLFETTKLGLQVLSRSILEGTVKDISGNALSGCEVSIQGLRRRQYYFDRTAQSGRFVITGISSGEYTIGVDTGQMNYDRFDKVFLKPGVEKAIELTLPFNARFQSDKTYYGQKDDSLVGVNVACAGDVLHKEGLMGRQFIKATPGTEYSLLAHNYTTRRVLCVITVDGLSVLDGHPGDLESGGYLVEPGRVLEIKGWRIDQDHVARFVFASAGRSYARLIAEPTDLGVIGCAFFFEKRYVDSGIRFSLGSAEGNEVGTGFGRSEIQRTRTVDFEREPRPFYVTRLLYIHCAQSAPGYGDEMKDPFPGCRIPSDWRG